MNEAEFKTVLRYFWINKKNHYFRVFIAAADKKKCMKRYNFVDWKSQLSMMSKYTKYAKLARTCI